MGWRSWFGLEEPEVKAASYTFDDLLRDYYGQTNSKAGQSVTLQTALETSAVFGCARVIAEGISQVPWKLYKRDERRGRIEAREHPLFDILHIQPNEWQTSFEFRETIALHLVLTGNAFVFINRSRSGEILELLPYEPGCVTVKRHSDASLTYQIKLIDGRVVELAQESIWHVRGPSWNSWEGLKAIHLARNAIGLSLATEEFGSSLFANGARPGGLLTTEQGIDADRVDLIRKAWQDSQGASGNAMRTAVLHSGLKYMPLSYTADEAQYNETQKAALNRICAFFRVNPIMVMQNEGTAAYASVEQLFIAHTTHTLMPWFERIGQSAIVNLLSRRERADGYYTKLDEKGLMRGTAKERAEYYQIMLQNGVIARNGVRASEDMDTIDDPEFDKPMPAANLYGPETPAAAEE